MEQYIVLKILVWQCIHEEVNIMLVEVERYQEVAEYSKACAGLSKDCV